MSILIATKIKNRLLILDFVYGFDLSANPELATLHIM